MARKKRLDVINKLKTESVELPFGPLNKTHKLQWVSGSTEEELILKLRKIGMPIELVNIYPRGTGAVAWLYTDAILKK